MAKVVQQIATTILAMFLLWGSQSRDDRVLMLESVMRQVLTVTMTAEDY